MTDRASEPPTTRAIVARLDVIERDLKSIVLRVADLYVELADVRARIDGLRT